MNLNDSTPNGARVVARFAAAAALGLAALATPGCSGGGSSTSSGVTGGSFQLLSIAGMPVGAVNTWKLNRRMEFAFSAPVDFSSINSSSIQIRQANGKQALGEFSLKPLPGGGVDPNTVVFQPRCPTESDYSDAGLDLGASYQVLLVGQDGGTGLSIRSAAGATLALSQIRNFVTPSSTLLGDLFFDTVSGPPSVILGDGTPGEVASGVRIGGPGGTEIPFELDGSGLPVEIPNVPVNLYSGGDQTLDIILAFDQPVNPADENIGAGRLRLQFSDPVSDPNALVWTDLPTEATLEENCTEYGARVRITPVGILPPDVRVRVQIASTFEDIVGDQNTLAVSDFSRFRTNVDLDPAFAGQALVDEVLEQFDDTKRFDDTAILPVPLARWEGNGELAHSFEFPKSPDPLLPADFDWVIETNTTEVLNTNGDVVAGGPGGANSYNQDVPNGVVYCRDLTVEIGATLRFEGTNPGAIYATGTVIVRGLILANGFDAADQSALSSSAPIVGAPGNLGGGRGGTASPSAIFTEPDPVGGPGFGPFQLPNFGGRGGESGYGHASDSFQPNVWKRRVGGGGGGVTIDPLSAGAGLSIGQATTPTPGNDGSVATGTSSTTAGMFGALTGATPPRGGAIGDDLFVDGIANNNFMGFRRLSQGSATAITVGELSEPTAGSGGGAGGDSIKQVNYPGNFVPGNNMRGASGAGGGGLLTIRCLGDFVVRGDGEIQVDGGRGATGERTLSAWFGSAGGSGGGSGGMLILETATKYDFSGISAAPPLLPVFWARGGYGGPGANQNGPTTAADYGSQNSGEAGGGNGGGGIIQLHVRDDKDIANYENITLGPYSNTNGLGAPNPFVCFPTFGPESQAQSKAIPLGGANLNPTSVLPKVKYTFSTLPPPNMGVIPVNGTNGVIAESIILTANATNISNVTKTVVVDASTLFADTTNNIYLRNPQLLRQSRVRIVNVATQTNYTASSATFDPMTNALTLQLLASSDLSAFAAGDSVRISPRFYRLESGGTLDQLDPETEVRIEFQGLDADVNGQPSTVLVDWTPDIADFNDPFLAPIKFFKYRVTFNTDKDADGLTGSEALPSLEFLRLMFEF